VKCKFVAGHYPALFLPVVYSSVYQHSLIKPIVLYFHTVGYMYLNILSVILIVDESDLLFILCVYFLLLFLDG
jgi:hypothetical protein